MIPPDLGKNRKSRIKCLISSINKAIHSFFPQTHKCLILLLKISYFRFYKSDICSAGMPIFWQYYSSNWKKASNAVRKYSISNFVAYILFFKRSMARFHGGFLDGMEWRIAGSSSKYSIIF